MEHWALGIGHWALVLSEVVGAVSRREVLGTGAEGKTHLPCLPPLPPLPHLPLPTKEANNKQHELDRVLLVWLYKALCRLH